MMDKYYWLCTVIMAAVGLSILAWDDDKAHFFLLLIGFLCGLVIGAGNG